MVKAKTTASAPILRNASEVMTAIRTKYEKPSGAWALLECVANGTGGRADRWADAIAMSVWPSRGLEIHGLEIKVSRSDLRRELDDPSKAEAVACYCDFWWVVVGSEAICKPGDLPSAWGLLVPKAAKDGATLVVAKEAKKLEPKALDRGFVASILRRAAERYNVGRVELDVRRDLHAKLHQEFDARYAESHQLEIKRLQDRIDTLQKTLDQTRGQLATAVANDFDAQRITDAMALLGTLDRWPGAEATIRNNIRDLDHGITRVQAIRNSLEDAARLAAVLVGRQPPESLTAEEACPPPASVAG